MCREFQLLCDFTQQRRQRADTGAMKQPGLRLYADATAPPPATSRLQLIGPSANAKPATQAGPTLVPIVSVAPVVKTAVVTPSGELTPLSTAAIVAAFDEAAISGEPAAAAFQRKERTLGQLFAALTVAEARALHRRLTIPTSDDPIAARFGRLVSDRQQRLLAFLADARRRAALADARSR